MPVSGILAGNAIGAARSAPKEKKGGLPSLGLTTAFKELAGGLSTIARVALPGSKENEPGLADVGKGFASSFLSTAQTGLSPLPGSERLLGGLGAGLLGEEYRPVPLHKQIGERGLLPPLVEAIGNVSLAGAAAGKGAALGKVGRVARADTRTASAAKLATEAPGSKAAVVAGRRAEKAGKKAAGLTGRVDEGAVAARAGTLRTTDRLSHPYVSLFNEAVRPVTRAANARQLDLANATEGGPELPPRTTTVRPRAAVHPHLERYYSRYGAALGAEPPNPVAADVQAQAADAGQRIADAYQAADFHQPDNPEVQAAYGKLTEEVDAQFEFLTAPEDTGGLGITVEFVDRGSNPYNAAGDVDAVADAMMADVAQNKRLYVDATGPDESHPVWGPEQNSKFRAVHDFFGHATPGRKFDRHGEESAYQHHARMFSPEARRALATETRGQNNVLIRTGDFPEQKAGLFPDDMVDVEYVHTAADATAAGVTLGLEAGPAERAARASADAPIPEWASRVVSGLSDRLLAPLAAGERKFQAVQTRGVYNERRRAVEATRRGAFNSEAVQASTGAAVSLLDGKRLPDGTPVTRELASDMVGAWLTRELDGTNALAESLQGVASKKALAEAGATRSPIPDELLSPELVGTMKRAADEWRTMADERLATLTSGRLGDRGLDQTGIRWTKAEQRALRQYQLDQKRIAKLEQRAVKEAAKAERIAARADDRLARLAEQTDNLRKQEGYARRSFDQARMPRATPREPAGWEPFVQATAENGGGTFDPRRGSVTPKAFGGEERGWASSVLDVEKVPAELWAAVNPVTGNTYGAEALHRIALDFSDLISQNVDVQVGTWINDGQVYVDLSQHTINGRAMSRDEALLLGAARNQQAVMDFNTGVEVAPTGRPDVAAQFVKRTLEWKKPTHRQRRAGELRRLVDRGVFDHEEVDAMMNTMDAAAMTMASAGKLAHPDDLYAMYRSKARKLANGDRLPAGTLFQTLFQGSMAQVWDDAKKALPDMEKAQRWYFTNHDHIEKLFRGQQTVLLDGTAIDKADLAYQLMAVTSVQATVQSNFGNTLAALNNLDEFVVRAGNDAERVEAILGEFEKAQGKAKTTTQFFELLTRDTHLYPTGVAREAVFEILSGRTLDTWTPDYFVTERADLWGRNRKSLSTKHIPDDLIEELGEERAVMEFHGSRAWAKLRSYWNNLRDPENSIDVTLDTWMGEFFGDRKMWEKAGKYAEHAQMIRAFADEMSEVQGTPVRPHEVQAALWAYTMQTSLQEALSEAKAAGDKTLAMKIKGALGAATTIPAIMAKPSKRIARLMDDMEIAWRPDNGVRTLFQAMHEEIKGALVVPENASVPMDMLFFKTADASTLLHEHAHVLRQALPQRQLAALENVYGVKDHTWTTAAEERFADDFMRYLAGEPTGAAHLAGAFGTVKGLLSEEWRQLRGHLFRDSLSPEVHELLDDLLDPPEAPINELGIPGLREAELSLRQRAQLVPKALGETTGQHYRRGVKAGGSVADVERIQRELGRKAEAVNKATAVRNDMRRILTEGTLPSQVQAAALSSRAEAKLGRLVESLDNPGLSQVPAVWKPLWGAIDSLTKAAEQSPELARELGDMPKTFTDVLKFASDRGFDPAHVRSFTPGEVERLVFGAVSLGKRGRDLGQTVVAGTRKARSGAFAREQSIEALVAAQVEVAHELNTNALVDFIEETWAKPVPEAGEIPRGWIAWDPERAFILTGERTPQGTVVVGEGTAVGRPRFMVPSQVRKSLATYEKDYNHWALNAIGKVTSPWRALILTWTPRWYVNNFVGNTVLATAEGVRLQDWKRAWDSYKTGFKDVPAVTGASIVSEFDTKSLIPRAGGRAGLREASSIGKAGAGRPGQLAETYRQAAHTVSRANSVVDEMARAAVYHSALRKGLSKEGAVNRAFTALVDYNDLSPFERSIVRTALPFYAWQKGIFKLVARFPIDHPVAAAVALMLGKMNRDYAERNNLPEAYEGLVDVPGFGTLNTRGFNPFQDAGQLTSPQGIAASLNPFVEIAVRNALGAPEGGFVEHQRLNEFGVLAPDTSPLQEFGELGGALPQVRLGGSLTGQQPTGQPASEGAMRFLGLPKVSDEQVLRIQERVRKSKLRQGQ